MATYTVKGGDSWARIAKIVYDDPRMLQALEEANQGINGLRPGMVIDLPDKIDNPVVTNDWWAQNVGTPVQTATTQTATQPVRPPSPGDGFIGGMLQRQQQTTQTTSVRPPAYGATQAIDGGLRNLPPPTGAPKVMPSLMPVSQPPAPSEGFVGGAVQRQQQLNAPRLGPTLLATPPMTPLSFWDKFLNFQGLGPGSMEGNYYSRMTPVEPLGTINTPPQPPAPVVNSTGMVDGAVQRQQQLNQPKRQAGKKYTPTAAGTGIYRPFNLEKVAAAEAWLQAQAAEPAFTPYQGYGGSYSGGGYARGGGGYGGAIKAATRAPEFWWGLVNWRV